MKRTIFAFIFPLLLASCSNQISDPAPADGEVSREFGEYSDFGSSLKDALSSAYSDGARSSALAEDESAVYTLPENQTGTEFLLEEGYVSSSAASYIQEVEKLLDADYDELEPLLADISKVEERAMEQLSSADLDSVMYFAESAKFSLEFWSEADCDGTEARGFRSWLKKKAKRIKKAVVSVAISVAAGIYSGASKMQIVQNAVAAGLKGYHSDALQSMGYYNNSFQY